MDVIVIILLVIGGLITLGFAVFVPGLLIWEAIRAIRRRRHRNLP